MKQNSGMNNPGFIKNHQASGWKKLVQIAEYTFAHLSIPVNQQFGLVALAQWELGNQVIGQGIIIPFNVNKPWIYFIFHQPIPLFFLQR
jgi:hypothetical protein